MQPEDFKTIRRDLGLSVTQIATVLRVTPRSVRRWEDGTRDIPGPAQVLVEALRTGTLPSIRF